MSSTKILITNNEYHIFKHDGIKDELPVGVYSIQFGPKGEVSLMGDEPLGLPKKLYDVDNAFIEHVKKSWDNLGQGVLGIGLVGKKGLGKSLTATSLAIQANLPVIKLGQIPPNLSFIDYLKQLGQNYVFYIDEFEKIFPNSYDSDDGRISQEQFLSFLDNGSTKNNKILFLITSNQTYSISEYLKNRPSRIRYYKNYLKLEDSIIKEIVNDLLADKESFLDDLLNNLPYEEINVDSLIKIIEEINLHKKPYSSFKDFFNFQRDADLDFKVEVVSSSGKTEILVNSMKNYLYDGSRVGVYTSRTETDKNRYPVYIELEDTLDELENPIEAVGYYHNNSGDKFNLRLLLTPNNKYLANSNVF